MSSDAIPLEAMMDTATLHPMLVHFPIALIIAAFAFDLAALVTRRPSFSSAALYTSALATLGAVAAYMSGEPAEEAAERIPGIEAVLERHEDLGKLLMFAAIALLAIRLVIVWRRWHEQVAARAVTAALSLGLVFLVGVTGFYGGKLVYEHGAGVAPVMRELPAEPSGTRREH